MKEEFVTITGFRNYLGLTPFRIGRLVRCEKEPDNQYDSEAIMCTLPVYGTVGVHRQQHQHRRRGHDERRADI